MASALTEIERIQIREKTPTLIMMHRQFCYRAADLPPLAVPIIRQEVRLLG